MIRRLPGQLRPCIRGIVRKPPRGVKRRAAWALLCRERVSWAGWLLLWLSGFLLAGFGPPRLVDREIAPTARVSVGVLRQWAESRVIPELTAAAYLVYDATSEQQLFGQATTDVRAPASLTKLMTALLVLEQADLGATVTVEPEDVIGGASMGLTAGAQVAVIDLLWGLLVPSGNDAALALARHVAGSHETFVAQMNERAAQLGLAQTYFVNPHGLDAAGHVSSAQDLLTLTRLLWANPIFRTMVGTARVTVNGRELRNTNEWLTTYPGAIGVKTGTTDAAGECLIAAVEREGRTLFVVILGSRARYADARRLVEATDAAFSWVIPDAAELSVLNRFVDADGVVRYLQPTGAAPTLLQLGPGVPVVRVFRRLALPSAATVQRGDQAGVLEWWAGTEQIGMQTLVVR